MKRFFSIVSLLVLGLALSAVANPYNTIQVNGTWDADEWDQANETYASNTFVGWNENGNVRDLLVTWDASNLYVGVKGNSWSNAMLIYIDSSSITTGQENADYFQGFVTQPYFDPDFVAGHFNMEWGDGAVPTDIRSISATDGTTSSLLGLAAVAVHDQNHDGGLGEGLTEIAIPWSLIGLEVEGSVRVAVSVGWANNTGPVIPAGGLGGFTGDELGGTDQSGGTDGDSSTLDTPVLVLYDQDGDGLPDQLADLTAPSLLSVAAMEGDLTTVIATFDESVTQASAENLSNWVMSGGYTLLSATQQANSAVVHLGLDADAGFGESYTITADNIDDGNGNVSDETTAKFCLAELTVQAHMNYRLLDEPGEIQDVAIEGSLAPLTWDPTCDDLMYDDGSHGDTAAGDSIFTTQLVFNMSYLEDPPEQELLYKFTYGCSEWESVDNHYYLMDCATGQALLDIWWNDNNPGNFTGHDIDVIFTVTGPPETYGINGSVLPLTWDFPSVTALSDDGYPGGVVDDDIYGVVVRFPENSLKEVGYKFTNSVAFECSTETDRNVFLNDEEYDTVGGDLGPLVMPVAYWDHCNSIWKDVELIFKVSFEEVLPPPTGEDVVALNGTPSGDPNVINWDVPSINPMADDGVAPDHAAGDLIYSESVIFPEYSSLYIEFKYLLNDEYECGEEGNRYFWIDPDGYDAEGNPQVLDLDFYGYCHPVAAEEMPVGAKMRLDANFPNPFNPKTTLRFLLKEEGPVQLAIYDIAGRQLCSLVDAWAPVGEHLVQWDGKDAQGRSMPSGIYFAHLRQGEEVQTLKMTLIK